MLTTHRLGRIAGVGALSTLLVLAACEQTDSPTGLQPPDAALNTAMQTQVVAGSVIVCQTVQAGSTTETGYYELDVDGSVTPFMITGTAPWPTALGNGPIMTAEAPGCVELENVSGDAMRVRVLNATGFATSGNRVSNSTSTWTFPGAQSNPAIDPDNPGSTAWFKPILEDVPEEGMEGCTPGAWRNQDGTGRNGKNRWIGTGYDLGDSFETVFGVDLTGELDGLTLRAALDYDSNSGGTALLKHATAALLNAAHPDVDYPYSVAEVISMFQSAWADLEADNNATKDMFDVANNLGCPI